MMAGQPPASGKNEGIRWFHWDQEAFECAQREDKPVLLSISAVWCYWCQVMEESTYTDVGLASYVNENFVPILVDNDHRPDVNARYNVGGWPTTAFLTPHGGYIAGATYLPPDQLLAMLGEVKRAYEEDKAGIYDQAGQLQRQRQDYLGRVAPGPELEHRLVDQVARRMAGAYDARNGGFGEEPKFPSAPILQLFLHLYRTTGEAFYLAILEKTLGGMIEGELYDSIEGGFFRYCSQADWASAQHEKMLADNVSLGRVYLDAGIMLGRPDYLQIASETIAFLTEALYSQEAGGFRGSQGAHSDYFTLTREARHENEAPPPDPYCYANWTCQAVSFLLEAAWKLSRPELSVLALSCLDNMVCRAEEGRLSHVLAPARQLGNQLTSDSDFLGDWANYLNALLDAHNCVANGSGYLGLAEEAMAQLDSRFQDQPRGVYFDIEADAAAVGYMRLRERPLAENMVIAEALLKLHHATGKDLYQSKAEKVLRAYSEAAWDFGEHVATYAICIDRFLHPPVEITVEGSLTGSDAQDLIAAAARVAYPNVVIKTVASDQNDRALAHVCVDTLCFPPVSQGDELAASVKEALEGPQNPVDNIFGKFVSF